MEEHVPVKGHAQSDLDPSQTLNMLRLNLRGDEELPNLFLAQIHCLHLPIGLWTLFIHGVAEPDSPTFTTSHYLWLQPLFTRLTVGDHRGSFMSGH